MARRFGQKRAFRPLDADSVDKRFGDGQQTQDARRIGSELIGGQDLKTSLPKKMVGSRQLIDECRANPRGSDGKTCAANVESPSEKINEPKSFQRRLHSA